MIRRAAIFGIGLAAAAALGSYAWAAQIRLLDIDRESGVYTLYAETFLEATPDSIFGVLLDYDRFNRISSVYKEYGYLDPAPDGTPMIFTRMEGCLLFYCLSMRRVERLEVEKPGVIRTVTLPEESDFKYSTSEWTLVPEADGTRMTYSLVMEPDFWVPPVIGPWYLKRTLQRGGLNAINRIERLAMEFDAEHQAALADPAAASTLPAAGLADAAASVSTPAETSASRDSLTSGVRGPNDR